MQHWLVRGARIAARRSSKNTKTAAHRARFADSKLRVEELEGRVVLSAYYVSPSGNDSNNGTSTSTPWKTIARVNTAELNPGDVVSFQGGATFASSTPLTLTSPKDDGSVANPILITSYGTGRATLSMTNNTAGIEGQHVSGYRITDLVVQGPGWSTSTKSGIWFYSWSSGALQYLHIDNVAVTGFGHAGIQVQASNGVSTYRDIEVMNSNLSGNKKAGFETVGPGAGGNHAARTIFDVRIADVRIYNNAGINFGSVYNGLIERSISANNGYTGDVPTGIFVYDSSYVTIRNNELYGNENYSTNTDGNGITLDYGSDHCIVEGNYTHGNSGAGILLVGLNHAGYPATTDNIIRYNISENDGTKYTFGAISVYRGVSNAEIYNNTVYTTQRDAFQIWDWKGTGIHVRNNIFMTSGAASQFLVQVFPPSNPAQNLKDLDVVFQGNNYYTFGGAFNIHYGDSFYNNLSSWRSGVGQEKLGGLPVGSSINPQLFAPGGGGTVGDPNQMDSLNAYKLRPRSRLNQWGLNLPALFGISPGSWDFYDNLLASSAQIAVGAHDAFDNGRGGNDGGRNGIGELTGDIAALSGRELVLSLDEGSPLAIQSMSYRDALNQPPQAVQVMGDESEIGAAPVRRILSRRVHEPVLGQDAGVDLF